MKRFIKNQSVIERASRGVVAVGQFANREVKRRPAIPVSERVRAYRNGYLSESVVLFEIDSTTDDRDYLSNWQWLTRTVKINGKHAIIHDHKVHMYHVLYSAFPECYPELYGYIDRGYRPTPFSSNEYATLDECLATESPVVSKPAEGSGGSNVRILRESEIDEPIDIGELDGRIIQECVTQADYASEINSESVNTLRLITMVDPDSGEPFIGAAVHRFGLGASSVDNWSSGGIAAVINTETGELGTVIGYPTGSTVPKYDTHPESGEQISGVTIPSWQAVRRGVLKMANYIADLTPYIGRDVAVTSESGEFAIIETNSNPDIDVIQPHIPLLADDRNRRFYEYHGIV